MIKYIITSILSILFLVQLSAQITTISGEVKNPNFYAISFQWENDIVSGIVKENLIALNGANEFSTPIEIEEPTVIHIKYGTHHKDIFLEPGDNLKMNFDANHFDYTFLFSGKGSENNKLLDAFEKEFEKYTDNFFIFEMAHKTNQEYRDYMNGVHAQMWAFYQKNSLSGISYHFRNYLKSEIDYRWAYNLLRYRYENPKANLQPAPISLPRVYYTFLDEVQVQNPSGLKNKYYHKFIDEYLSYRKESGAKALKKFTVKVESNSLTLRDEPKTGNKIYSVSKGEILEYLKERSKLTSQVYTRGKRITTHWIKVRTSNGQIGWVIEGGVDFVRSSDDTDLGALARSGKYNNAGKHLKGKVLEYYIAKELHESVRGNGKSYSEKDFKTFLNTAQNAKFKSCIQKDYNIKFGGGTADNLVLNSTNNVDFSATPTPNGSNPNSNTPPPTTSTSKKLNVAPKRVIPRGTNYAVGFSKSTELKGKVEHPTAKSIDIVFYKDKFAFEEESLNLPLNSRNEFNLVFDISGPTIAKLIYDGSEVEIFLEPGDALEMAFEGKDFVSSINFGGKCGGQNNFLSQFNNKFREYDDDYVYREIVGKSPSVYRFQMDKIKREKWNYYQKYDMKEKRSFSANFAKYISAEIDYWWAYNLLRYHWEHPAANGLAFPMRIDANYYSFLGKVRVSNDDAIASKSYLSFVTLYLKLREDNANTNITNQIRQGTFKNNMTNEEIMSTPGGTNSITFLFKGETVKYLNAKSPSTTSKLINGVIKTDHWYQVATNDGYIGWVFGAAGTIDGVDDKVVGANEKFKTIEEEKEVVKTVAVANVDRLRIRREPNLPSAIGFANEGDELLYLGRKSPQRYTFTLRGQTFNDYFYKIETPSGETGWVFGGGMELQERKTKEKVYRREPIAKTTRKQTGKGGKEMYLTGRALYYTRANDIYWKCKGAEPEEIKKEVDRFINNNPYKEYDVAIQTAYDDAIRRIYSVPVKKDDSAEIAAKAAAEKEAKRIAEEKRKAEAERIAAEKREADLKEKIRLNDIRLAEIAKEKARLAAEEKRKLEEERIRKEKADQRLAELKAAKLKAEKEAQELADAEERKAAQEEAERIRKEELIAEENERIAAEKEAKRLADLEAQRKETLRLERIAEKERIAEEKAIAKAAATAERKRIADEKAAAKAAKKAARLAEIERKKNEKIEKERLAKEAADAEIKRLADLAEAKRKEEEEAAAKASAENQGGTSVEVVEPIEVEPAIDPTPSVSVAPKTPTVKESEPKIRRNLTPADLFAMIDMTSVEMPKSQIAFTGKIANHRQKDAKIILYPDPVSMKEVVYNLYVRPDGNFSTKLRLSRPTIGKLVYGSRLVELYIEPGDAIQIAFDAKDFLNSLNFTGAGGVHNNFLKNLRVNYTNQDKEAKGKVFSESNPKAFKKFLKKIHEDKLSYYRGKLHEFSGDFSHYAKASIDYWYSYNLTNYRWEHPLNHHQPAPMVINDRSFYDFMDEIPLNNPQALPNEYYAYFIDVFLDDRKKEPENLGLTKLELATKYLEGQVMYFYKAKVLGAASRNGELSNVIFDVKMFMDACTYEPYRESMKNALRESNTMLPGMQAPNFNLVDVKGKKVSLSDYKGKVIYLDFWATWCTSCIRQISNTSEMRRQLKGQDIVFIYVSLDNTDYDWKRFVTRNRVTGTHLFAEGALSSVTATDYGVKQLPTAFIIDKDGKIVENKSKIVKNNSMNGSSSYTLMEQLRALAAKK